MRKALIPPPEHTLNSTRSLKWMKVFRTRVSEGLVHCGPSFNIACSVLILIVRNDVTITSYWLFILFSRSCRNLRRDVSIRFHLMSLCHLVLKPCWPTLLPNHDDDEGFRFRNFV